MCSLSFIWSDDEKKLLLHPLATCLYNLFARTAAWRCMLHAACHMHCATVHNKSLIYVAACGVPREASCCRAWISAKQTFWRAKMRHRRVCGSRRTLMYAAGHVCMKLIKSNDKSMSFNIERLRLLLLSVFYVFFFCFCSHAARHLRAVSGYSFTAYYVASAKVITCCFKFFETIKYCCHIYIFTCSYIY